MNPNSSPSGDKASKREVIFAFIISFFIAVILTAVIFSDSNSEFPTTFFFIVVPAVVIVLLFLTMRLSGKSKERIGRHFRIFIFLDLVTHELIANRISLLIILFLLGLFFGMGQAEELLLHLADSRIAPPFFYGVLMLLALLSWYWTRFMYLQNIRIFKAKDMFSGDFKEHLKHKNSNVAHIRGILPKFLGLIIILIPTFFMLKLYMSNVSEGRGILVIVGTLIMFWVLALIVYAFSKVSFYEVIKAWLSSHKYFIIILVVLFAALSAALFFSPNMNSPTKIPLLYLSGLVVAIFYFLISSIGIEKMFFVRQKKPKNRISRIIFIGAIVFSLIFIAFNCVPLFFNINGLTILLCGLVFYSFLAYFFIILGGKIKVPVLTLLIVIGATVALKFAPNTGLHDIRLVESKFDVDERVHIKTYVAKWFKHNEANIKAYKDEGKKFPIVFISSEGGGSRAALWTLLSHDALETRVDNYYEHIFSMSGASGGNTGNSFYLAFQEIRNDDTPVRIRDMADNVFSNDFVSTDIGMLFGRDTWQSIFCSSFFDDRSEILQQKWEDKFEEADRYGYSEKENPLQYDFLSFWYDSEEDMANSLSFQHPLFLLSTTHVQSGDHATLSPVQLYDFIPQNMDVLEEVSDKHDGKSIPLSSGALMNARFPIVCPSGKIDKVGNFVDAGYSDNTGGAETRATILAVIEYLNQPGDSLFKEDFNLVHIAFRNGLPNDDVQSYVSVRTNRTNVQGDTLKQEPYKIYEAPAEIGVPLVGLAGAAFAHPNKELAEIQFIVDTTLYFDLARTPIEIDSVEQDTITPILPLSRHLSNLAILSMHARMRIIMSKDANMVKGLKHIFDLK